ncbi:MAG: sigma-70 family RNA polymerase sigma factor [candidate division Zixibacteria bacterium]|nr:sigma-70 family RNA polymerase sigma factor [candidate division Zixibacteria bacterium]
MSVVKGSVLSAEAERELASRYVAGDRAVYRQVDSWIKQVTSLSTWHFVADTEDIASIVQLKLFTNLQARKFRGESTFRTYVQRIARYTCIDEVRKQRVQRDADRRALPVPAPSEVPDELQEKREEYEVFLKIFRAIGSECQRLWRMIFSESLTYKEIGEYLGIPEGTVKRKVHECKKTAIDLKEKLL